MQLGQILIGTADTNSIHPPNQPRLDNPIPVKFNTPFSEPPKVILAGLTHLDMDSSANVRIECVSQNVRNDGMSMNLRSWDDTVQHGSACTWLARSNNGGGIQSGHFPTTDDHPPDQPKQKTSRRITFQQRYTSPPKVVVWFDELDIEKSANCRVKTYADSISADGFTIHIESWADSVTHSAAACWLAYPADRTDMCSGTYTTQDVRPPSDPRPQTEGNVSFPITFSKPPRLFLALNLIDVDHNYNMRIHLSATNVTNTGMKWHNDSWADTRLHEAGASYIALA